MDKRTNGRTDRTDQRTKGQMDELMDPAAEQENLMGSL